MKRDSARWKSGLWCKARAMGWGRGGPAICTASGRKSTRGMTPSQCKANAPTTGRRENHMKRSSIQIKRRDPPCVSISKCLLLVSMLSLFRVFVGLSLCFLFLRDMFRWMPWATPYESLRAQAASSHDGGGGRQAGNDALWALDNLSWPPPLVTMHMHTFPLAFLPLFALQLVSLFASTS